MFGWSPHYGGQTETLGALTASSRGTLVTANASADTKGTYANIGTAGFDYHGIMVQLAAASAGVEFVIDLALDDGSSNNSILVPDLRLSAFKGAGSETGVSYFLPLHIPNGTIIDARAAANAGGATVDCSIIGMSNGLFGFPGFSRAIALYAQASSRGVAIDPGGTANTEGAYAVLTSSTSERICAIVGYIGPNLDVSRAASSNMLLDLARGAASSEFPIISNIHLSWSSSIDQPITQVFGPIPCDIPSGTRIAARAQCSINTAGDRTVDLAAWGFVP